MDEAGLATDTADTADTATAAADSCGNSRWTADLL